MSKVNLKKKTEATISYFIKLRFRLLTLVIFFIIISEIIFKLPYIILIIKGFEPRVIVLWILILLILRPQIKTILITIIIFTFLFPLGEFFGIMVYLSLIYVLFKLMKDLTTH